MNYPSNTSNNLPPEIDDFLNREAYIEALNEYLFKQKRKYISVSGEAGMGKTSLVLEFAYSILDKNKFDAVVWSTPKDFELVTKTNIFGNKRVKNENFVSQRMYEGTWVNSLDDLYILISHVSGYINQDIKSDISVRQNEVIAWMNEKRILLILDDLDSWDWGDVLNFVSKVPDKSAVIITSRRIVDQQWLEDVKLLDLDSLSPQISFKLIDNAVKSEGFKIKSDQKNKIFKFSGGNPLVIQLTTSLIVNRLKKTDILYPLRYIGLLPQITIDNLIDKVLDDIRRSSEARRFLFDDLYNNLTPDERDVLLFIAVFSENYDQQITDSLLNKMTGFEKRVTQDILIRLNESALIQLEKLSPLKLHMHSYIIDFVTDISQEEYEFVKYKIEQNL